MHIAPSLVLWHAFHVCPFVKKSPCMHSSFVHSWKKSPFMFSTCSSHSSPCHVLSMHLYLQHSWQDDIKSINILVYHNSLSFSFKCRWLGERTRLWNCTRQIWSWDARSGHCQWKLHRSHWETEMDNPNQWWLSAGSISTRRKICAISWGRQCMQQRELATKTVQFLPGAGNGL